MHDGSNAGEIKGGQAIVSAIDEMAALDAFGPMARNAFYNSSIKVLALSVLEQIQEQQKTGAFPMNIKEPEIDRWLAERVMMGCYHIILGDRAEIDARLGCQPLVSRKLKRMR